MFDSWNAEFRFEICWGNEIIVWIESQETQVLK